MGSKKSKKQKIKKNPLKKKNTKKIRFSFKTKKKSFWLRFVINSGRDLYNFRGDGGGIAYNPF